MLESRSRPFTQLLNAAVQGDNDAAQQFFALVYEELRRMAADHLEGDGAGRHIQPTTLVHEAYLRLFRANGDSGPEFENRRHFFGAAAESMRQICVDYARRWGALKRGAGLRPLSLSEQPGLEPIGMDRSMEVLAINEALEKLARVAPRQADIVKQRFFVGLTGDETAEVLGIAPRTVDADWRLAQAWLRREMTRGEFDSEDAADGTHS